ncbi:MAG TPA: hypothetical protein VIX80_03815 [Candidatus Kapabacteria bacterium]
MKYIFVLCITLLTACSFAQGVEVFLSLTAEDGKTTTVIIDERGTSEIPYLARGKYSASLMLSSPSFTPKSFPRSVQLEWLSVDRIKKRRVIVDNQMIEFKRDTSGVLVSGPIGKVLTIENEGSYSALCKTHISPIYTKENK